MIIDSIVDKRDLINISDVSLPELPRRELEERRRGYPQVMARISELRDKTGDWHNLAILMFHAKMVFPEHSSGLVFDAGLWEKIKEAAENNKGRASILMSTFPAMVAVKMLAPEFLRGYDLSVVYRVARTEIGISWGQNLVFYALSLAADLRVLSDEYRKIPLKDEAFEAGLDELARQREAPDYGGFCREMKNLRICFPERFGEIKIEDRDWEGMRKVQANLRQAGRWEDWAKLTYAMVVISADRIEFSDRGLKLHKAEEPKKLDGDVPPMPVRRRF